MNQNISDEHQAKILQAMDLKKQMEEKRMLSLGNKEAILKLKDTTLEAYTDYRSLKSKIGMAMELAELFKG